MNYTEKYMVNHIMSEIGCNENQANVIYSTAYYFGQGDGLIQVYQYVTELCRMIISFENMK